MLKVEGQFAASELQHDRSDVNVTTVDDGLAMIMITLLRTPNITRVPCKESVLHPPPGRGVEGVILTVGAMAPSHVVSRDIRS